MSEVEPMAAPSVTGVYQRTPSQDQVTAQARATALNVTLGPVIPPPHCAPYCSPLPGVIGMSGGTMVGYRYDDGQITSGSVATDLTAWQAHADDIKVRADNREANRGAAAWAMMDQLQVIIDRPALATGTLTMAVVSPWARQTQIDVEYMAGILRKVLRWLGDEWDAPN